MKKYLIKKGKHYSFRFPFLVWNKKRMEVKFRFDDSAVYQIDSKNQSDWNKIFGFSRGFHHRNSIRLAWRWNQKISKVEIAEYRYTDGIRSYSKPILAINPNETHTLEISIGNPSSFKLGYILYPYFGGNIVTPHDISVQVSYSFL